MTPHCVALVYTVRSPSACARQASLRGCYENRRSKIEQTLVWRNWDTGDFSKRIELDLPHLSESKINQLRYHQLRTNKLFLMFAS